MDLVEHEERLMHGISQPLSAYQRSESLQREDSPLPSSANMAVDLGKVASIIFSIAPSQSHPFGFSVLTF